MEKVMKNIGLILVAIFALAITACEKEDEYVYEDGTYYAEMAEYSHGWKAFLEVTIQDDNITSADFDNMDADGNLKSETTVESYPMDPHPTIWIPDYEARIVAADLSDFDEIDVYTGATGAYNQVNALMDAILSAAKDGDTSDQIVTME
jgi:major membrane immunogen (membrane-anchored lipoprotein)